MNPTPTRAPLTRADFDEVREAMDRLGDRLIELAEAPIRRRSELDHGLLALHALVIQLTERVAKLEAKVTPPSRQVEAADHLAQGVTP